MQMPARTHTEAHSQKTLSHTYIQYSYVLTCLISLYSLLSSTKSEGVIDLKLLNISLNTKNLRLVTDGHSTTNGITTLSNPTPTQTNKKYVHTLNGALF